VDHGRERVDVEVGEVVVETGNGEAEGGGEALLVADHDVDVRRDGPVDLLGLPLPPDRLPQARPVVEVV
jgi:hypothetical protein